ncbi:MAG: GAF domain-containing protein [Syntrophales bacterium]
MTEEEIRPDQSADLRHKAEEIARENANREDALPQDFPTMTTMIHELRVHQIEQEMQNSALRQKQEELAAARARYFDLYDLAPVGYVTVSKQGLVIEANLTAATMLGVARGVPGLAQPIFSQFIHIEDQDIYYLFRKQLFKTTGKPQACDLRMVKKDGPVFWAHLEATVAQDTGGEPVVRIVMSDMTAQKRNAVMEARLRIQIFAPAHSLKELLQATLTEAEALTGSQVGFYHFVEPDQGFLTLQAWSANTLQHMCQTTDHVSHYPVNEAGVWADCIRERRPVVHNDYATLPHRKGLPAGHTPVIRELVVPVLRGDAIVAVVGVGNKPENYDERDIETVTSLADLTWDIADRKRAEEALRESEQSYHNQFANNLAVMLLIDPIDGKIIDANAAALGFYGYHREQMLTLRITDVNNLHASEVRQAMESVPQGEGKRFKFQHRLADGSLRDVEVLSSGIQFGGRTVLHSIIQDTTERIRTEQEMVVISDIGRLIGSTLNIDEVYEQFAAETRKLIPFDRVAVNLHGLQQGIVRIAYVSGDDIPGRKQGDTFPLKGSVSEVLVKTKTAILSNPESVEEMEKQFSDHSGTISAGMRSVMAVPLISRNEVIASLHFRSKKPNTYTERDLRLAEKIGIQIAGAVANAQLFDDVSRAGEALKEERRQLQQALDEVRTLRGIVPICAYCKKIRDDEGYWNQVEQYVSKHTEAKFSHGICPACFEREMKRIEALDG